MPFDLYTKLVLTAIAAALVVLCLRGLSFVGRASAQSTTHCTGTLAGNSNGDANLMVGRYDIDVRCE